MFSPVGEYQWFELYACSHEDAAVVQVVAAASAEQDSWSSGHLRVPATGEAFIVKQSQAKQCILRITE